jgi:peptidoglycan/LPS O-acetylase OafA/YrhL
MYSYLNFFRFYLAWSVLAFHMNVFAVPLAGPIAVWCFFFISGFLVTNILSERYSGRHRDFLTNRFLRIFPTYWATLLIGMLLITIDSKGVLEFNPNIYIPNDFSGWLTNILIFNLSEPPRIVPPAWSLAVELNWYVILFTASFFPKKWVLTFLYANLLLPFVIYFFLHQSIYQPGAGFAFALGAIAYHSKLLAPKILQYLALVMIPIVMYVIPVKFGLSAFNMTTLGFNLSLVGSVLLLFISMPLLTKEGPKSWFSNISGDLSYPVFLTHQYAAWLAINWVDVPRHSWGLVFFTTIISLMISAVIVKLVEHPIAKVRMKIRNRNRNRN